MPRKMGQISTTKMTYKMFFPKFVNILLDLDSIVAGNGSNISINKQHNDFLKDPLQQSKILSRNIIYGNYSDNIIRKMCDLLIARYITSVSLSFLQPAQFLTTIM